MVRTYKTSYHVPVNSGRDLLAMSLHQTPTPTATDSSRTPHVVLPPFERRFLIGMLAHTPTRPILAVAPEIGVGHKPIANYLRNHFAEASITWGGELLLVNGTPFIAPGQLCTYTPMSGYLHKRGLPNDLEALRRLASNHVLPFDGISTAQSLPASAGYLNPYITQFKEAHPNHSKAPGVSIDLTYKSSESILGWMNLPSAIKHSDKFIKIRDRCIIRLRKSLTELLLLTRVTFLQTRDPRDLWLLQQIDGILGTPTEKLTLQQMQRFDDALQKSNLWIYSRYGENANQDIDVYELAPLN
jgi:hypothetical protein